MRPRCSILTSGLDFSGCGDCTSCPPFEQVSNSEPSAIMLQGIPCMCGLYKFRFLDVSLRIAAGTTRKPALFPQLFPIPNPVRYLVRQRESQLMREHTHLAAMVGFVR